MSILFVVVPISLRHFLPLTVGHPKASEELLVVIVELWPVVMMRIYKLSLVERGLNDLIWRHLRREMWLQLEIPDFNLALKLGELVRRLGRNLRLMLSYLSRVALAGGLGAIGFF